MFIDGKKISSLIKKRLVNHIKDKNIHKKMAIFYVGKNDVIDNFISLKKRFGEDLGFLVEIFQYDEKISTDFLIKEIKNKSKDFNGVVVQLPLPNHIKKEKVLNSIPQEKDIDILSKDRYKEFLQGNTHFLPPVAGAVSEIINYHGIDLKNKKIVVVGEGMLVGRPVYDWLRVSGFNPIIVTVDTKLKEEIFKDADIIISGVGISGLIKKDNVKNGVILIDAGSSSEKGKILGDIERNAIEKASLFSSVPGGVGPITIAILFKNLVYN